MGTSINQKHCSTSDLTMAEFTDNSLFSANFKGQIQIPETTNNPPTSVTITSLSTSTASKQPRNLTGHTPRDMKLGEQPMFGTVEQMGINECSVAVLRKEMSGPTKKRRVVLTLFFKSDAIKNTL